MQRHIADVMVPVRDYARQVQFYKEFLGLETVFAGKEFTLLRDGTTKQTVCLADGTALTGPCVSVQTDDLATSLDALQKAGGSVRKRWEFPQIRGAICADPEGREMMLWQGDRQAKFG
jgi:predicted enzyme related to lactoylglutathione lyase